MTTVWPKISKNKHQDTFNEACGERQALRAWFVSARRSACAVANHGQYAEYGWHHAHALKSA